MLLFDSFLCVFLLSEGWTEAVDGRGCALSGTFRTYGMCGAPGGQCINYQACHIPKPPSSPPNLHLPAGVFGILVCGCGGLIFNLTTQQLSF